MGFISLIYVLASFGLIEVFSLSIVADIGYAKNVTHGVCLAGNID